MKIILYGCRVFIRLIHQESLECVHVNYTCHIFDFTVTADRYCRILKSEGGLELLETVQTDPRTMEDVKILARNVIDQVLEGPKKVKQKEDDHSEENMDD